MAMQGSAFHWVYVLAGLSGLVAVTVILRRLRFGALVVASPVLSVAVLTLLFGFSAASFGLRPFSFGLIAASTPGLTLVPPIFAVMIAASSRLSGSTGDTSVRS
jgi:hypothetical protein